MTLSKIRKIFIESIFILALLLTSTINVFAETLKIDALVNQLKNDGILKELFNEDLTVTNNKDSKTIDITVQEFKISLNYFDDYIEYTNPTKTVTESNCNYELFKSIAISDVIYGIISLSGHKNISSLGEIENYDGANSYEEYGLVINSKDYTITSEDSGVHMTMSGDLVEYFKISLDTTKIDKLVEKYGTIVKEGVKFKPLLAVGDTTDNSITLKLLDYGDDPRKCYIYRSNTKD